jgi:hypothetical protein
MKYESIVLQALFAVCLLVCVLTFGAMIAFHAPAPTLAAVSPASISASHGG